MPFQRIERNRPSERDVALTQVQIAAQARNKRWYAFLCAKRDELQARLRQQGYGEGSRPEQQLHAGTEPDVETRATVAQSSVALGRWGAATDQEVVAQPDNTDSGSSETADSLSIEPSIWWGKRDNRPL